MRHQDFIADSSGSQFLKYMKSKNTDTSATTAIIGLVTIKKERTGKENNKTLKLQRLDVGSPEISG